MSNEVRPIALSAAEAAKALSISRNTFDAEVAPHLEWFTLGGREVVSYTTLERWIANRARGRHEVRTKEAA
jgi:hypothetical protein